MERQQPKYEVEIVDMISYCYIRVGWSPYIDYGPRYISECYKDFFGNTKTRNLVSHETSWVDEWKQNILDPEHFPKSGERQRELRFKNVDEAKKYIVENNLQDESRFPGRSVLFVEDENN